MLKPNSPIEKICKVSDPLTWNEEKSNLMIEAVKESAEFHKENNKAFNKILDYYNFDTSKIASESDLSNLPSLSVYAMKNHLLLSRDEKYAELKMTSSGTSGLKTQAWMDQGSIDRAQSMLRSIWNQEKLISDQKTNYMLFVYNPEQAKDLGVAFSAKNRTQFAPPNRIEYAIHMDKSGQWEFQKDRVVETLLEYQREGLPVRLLGITGFIYEFILHLQDRYSLQLPENSFLFTTGGWKAAESKKITRDAFQVLASEKLGLKIANIRDGFGMAEHGAPYWQCRDHKLHIPAFNRVYAVDPRTLNPLKKGQLGLLKLLTPYNTMMPNLSILTTDTGIVHEQPCSCGWNSPTFEVIGRAGLSKAKGCAIHADEIVKRS